MLPPEREFQIHRAPRHDERRHVHRGLYLAGLIAVAGAAITYGVGAVVGPRLLAFVALLFLAMLTAPHLARVLAARIGGVRSASAPPRGDGVL